MVALGALGGAAAATAADTAATAGTLTAAATSAAAIPSALALGGTAATSAASTGLLSTLSSITPLLTGGSALLSAIGSVASGKQQAGALDYNAQVDKINAGTALSTSEADVQRQQIAATRAVATGANAYGASGVNLGSGSPLDVLADHAAQGALDSEITRWKGGTQADAYLNNAGQATYQAGQASTAGDIQAGTTLLTTGARYAASQLPRGLGAGGL